jgi:hypothetical protein
MAPWMKFPIGPADIFLWEDLSTFIILAPPLDLVKHSI